MDKSIGALWIRTGNSGEFWKGYIELEDGKKQNIIVFKNTYKKDKQPDFRVFEAKQKEEQTNTNSFPLDDSLLF